MRAANGGKRLHDARALRRVLLLLLYAVTSAACGRCGGDEPSAVLAHLLELQGSSVARDFAAQRERWEPAQLGAEFRLGDGLRTRAPSTALLGLIDGSRLQVQPDTVIRFLAAGEGEQGIDVLTGEALLFAGRRDVPLRTHVGLAVIAAGSRVRLARVDDALDLRVEVGEARFRSSDGEDVRLAAGDEVRLQIGMAVLRTPQAPDASAIAAEEQPREPSVDAGVAANTGGAPADPDARGRRLESGASSGPDYSNVEARAGDSFVVHAPEVPVAIAFELGHKCKGDGVLEIERGTRVRGKGSANLLFPAGVRGYTLRCIDARGAPSRVVARGSVRVLQDAGTRKLPPSAPTSQVDVDGRSYTIYYQNQLPNVRVRWPNAPSTGRYTLDVDGERMTLSDAEHLFRSGDLRDGVHRLTFEAKERRSRTTTVAVRFDNAAPTASLTAPTDRSFAPGGEVAIEGMALPGWKVTVRGGTISKDEDDRFEGQVVTSAERPDVAVRLSHPRLGTHYYLRRAQGSR